MSQQILELNEAELKYIDANLQVVQLVIKTFAPQHGEQITLAALDAAFTAWLAQHDIQQEDPNPFINAFGIGFGQYLVNHLDLKWVAVTDDNGTEMAVHGQPGDILVFPPNFVAKRYETKTTGFFEPYYPHIAKIIADVRSRLTQQKNAPRKPRWKFWGRDN